VTGASFRSTPRRADAGRGSKRVPATLPREPACRFDAVPIDGASPPRIEWQRHAFAVE
jgi:hypothetical protein